MNVQILDGTQTQESVIIELSRRLREKDAQIQSITQQRDSLEGYLQQNQKGDGYDILRAKYDVKDAELQVANETNSELRKLVNELQHVARKGDSSKLEITELREELKYAEKTVEKREATISSMKEEKAGMEKKQRKLKDELASYEELLEKSKALAEEQIGVLLSNDKTIHSLQDKIAKMKRENEALKDTLKENKHTIESKDALLNMQRQELDKNERLVKNYETKFEAKGRDFDELCELADEADRMWSKIEEREKKFQAKDIMLSAFRDRNSSLQVDKKRLEAEVDELKKCFELSNLKLNGTNDKIDMPWLLTQLRDSVNLSEKIVELEEIIRCEGYTVKARQAENSYKEKEAKLTAELEKVSSILDILSTQTKDDKNFELPIMLGKLEEALHVTGQEYDIKMVPRKHMNGAVSVASVSINNSMSMVSNSSYNEWIESKCITTRDFKDLMDPRSHAIMSSLVYGFEGMCCVADDDYVDGDVDDRDDILSADDRDDILSRTQDGILSTDQRSVDDDDDNDVNGDDDKVEEEMPANADGGKGEEQLSPRSLLPDVHIDKVLKILTREDDKAKNDWKNWLSPPTSPLSCLSVGTTAAVE